jgi:hypothetical protein
MNLRIEKARGSRLTSLTIYLMIFTCATPYTKSKGLSVDILYHLFYAFYMHSVVDKKQGPTYLSLGQSCMKQRVYQIRVTDRQ